MGIIINWWLPGEKKNQEKVPLKFKSEKGSMFLEIFK
jgi:hypothetical protein